MQIKKFSNSLELSTIGKALTSSMVRSASVEEIEETLTKSIARAFQDLGQRAIDHDGEYLISTMTQEVKKRHPNMRVEEIPIAIENGIRGEYGEYFGLNVISFSTFFKKYMESEQRTQQALILRRDQEPAKKEPTQEEKEKAETEMIVSAFDKFKKTGFYEDYGNQVYNKLDERSKIPFNKNRKIEIFKKAKERLLQKYSPANAATLNERSEFSKNISTIMQGEQDSTQMIVTEAKKIALHILFEELIELEMDFKSWLHEEESEVF